MPSATVTQRGIPVVVGFNGVANSIWLQMETSGDKASARTSFIRDENNNRCTMLISNKGRVFTLSGTVKDDVSHTFLTALRALNRGSLITITSPVGGTAKKCSIQDVDLKFSRTQATGTITARYIVDIDPT